jgi:hypothetical protein
VCFQVWKKNEVDRDVKILKSKSDLFSFVKKNEDHDIEFRRVGFYAGRTFLETIDKSEESHYFIKSNIDLNILVDKFNSIKWDT